MTSSTMINAHWGLVNNEDRNLRVYEGNRTAKSQYYDSRTIVNSNLQLIDTVDMGLYFNGRNSAELTAFRNRAAHLGENNDTIIMLNDAANRDVYSEALNDRVREDAFQEGEMTERVDLRGKVITLRFG